MVQILKAYGPPLALVAAIFAAPIFGACVDESSSRRALSSSGYADIELGGYAWFDCGRDDTFATEFSATNQAGVRVSGAVCCGFLKSCTVRF